VGQDYFVLEGSESPEKECFLHNRTPDCSLGHFFIFSSCHRCC